MDLIVQTDPTNDLLYLAFSKRAMERASVARSKQITDDIVLDFDDEGHLLGIEVLNASDVLDSDVGRVTFDSLVGVKEAAGLLRVRRSNFIRDYANKDDFPPPVCELASGRIWLRSQVLDYAERHRRLSA